MALIGFRRSFGKGRISGAALNGLYISLYMSRRRVLTILPGFISTLFPLRLIETEEGSLAFLEDVGILTCRALGIPVVTIHCRFHSRSLHRISIVI